MKSWKSTIGGAFAALGTMLIGVGVVPQLSGTHSETLTVVAWIGFGCQGVGVFFGHLFAADNDTVQELKVASAENRKAIISGDSSVIEARQSLEEHKEKKT